MPTKRSLDARTFQRTLPCFGRTLFHRMPFSPSISENVIPVSTQASAQHCQRVLAQGNANGPPGLGLIWMNPCHAASHVELIPSQERHVALPESRRQCELRHVPKVFRQLRQESSCFLRGQETHALSRFPVQPDFRNVIRPFPIVLCPPQDRTNQSKVAVRIGLARFFG